MPIDDTVLHGRIPRLGTISTGYGVEATSKRGNPYSQPTRAETLVFHTDDPAVANAVQHAFNGDLRSDSPTWEHDVVTDRRRVDVLALPLGFRQALEAWRTAECVRRCDGVAMSMLDGRPTSGPCVCAQEMAQGAERLCSPSTLLPVFIDLPVDRFGVWEVRSGSWGTASNFKGAVRALEMVGAAKGAVPAVLSMQDRTVRDATGEVREVTELALSISERRELLSSHGASPLELPADRPRQALMHRWHQVEADARRRGLRDRLKDAWIARFGMGTTFDALSDDDLVDWVADAEALVTSDDATSGALPEGQGQGDETLPAEDAPPASP